MEFGRRTWTVWFVLCAAMTLLGLVLLVMGLTDASFPTSVGIWTVLGTVQFAFLALRASQRLRALSGGTDGHLRDVST